MNRRNFLRVGASAIAIAKSTQVGNAATNPRPSAGDKVTVAIMGVRSRGIQLAREFSSLPDVNVAYICDVDQSVVGPALKIVEELKSKRPKVVADIRSVIDDKTVDAVVMATPIHWHAAGTILACEAGKDVYVEKPVSHNIREGRLMIEVARRYGRVVQVGSQSRSRPVTQTFVDYVRSGKIGKVLMAKVWNVQMRANIGRKPDGSVPGGVDYDTWTGPVPLMPYNPNRFHGTVNWHWHYGTGDIGNDGIHTIDVARWALGVDYPTEVSGMGRKLFFDDDQQTPDTQNLSFNYEGKVILYEQRLWNGYRSEGSENGVAIYGTDGMAQTGRWVGGHWAFRVYDVAGKLIHYEQESAPDNNTHARNFIDCIRSRRAPNADIETGHVSTVLCHLGNIVTRTGRHIRFDANTESILGDTEANRYIRREYRKHWSTPKNG